MSKTIKTSKKRIILIVLALLIVALGTSAVLYARKHRNTKTVSVQPQTNFLEPQADPNNLHPAVLGAQTQATQVYKNDALKFSAEIPSDWTASDSKNEVVFSDPGKLKYSVQVYEVSGGDLVSLESFLKSQSNLKNIVYTSIAGHSAFSFDTTGAYKHGYAFLSQGHLYYLLGTNIENTLLAKNFKTL